MVEGHSESMFEFLKYIQNDSIIVNGSTVTGDILQKTQECSKKGMYELLLNHVTTGPPGTVSTHLFINFSHEALGGEYIIRREDINLVRCNVEGSV